LNVMSPAEQNAEPLISNDHHGAFILSYDGPIFNRSFSMAVDRRLKFPFGVLAVWPSNWRSHPAPAAPRLEQALHVGVTAADYACTRPNPRPLAGIALPRNEQGE